ncbi:hypothetical protein BGZ76_000559 [Entomortierella beljakovae]|nr:hypothetical protein BGZ76_000559 [Entomortierella beljakovae]
MKFFLIIVALTSSVALTEALTGVVNTGAGGGPINVRSGPGTSFTVVGSLNNGASVAVSCSTTGTSVTGTYGTSNIWDKVPSGYVADTYMNTNGVIAPTCALTGTINTGAGGGPLNIRSGPGTTYSITGSVNNGATVAVDCYTTGTTVTGTLGTTSIWDHIPGGYVSDAYVDTNNKLPAPCSGGGGGGGTGNLPGLTTKQSGYARTIANQAHNYGVGLRGCVVAIATAFVESNILVYCNYAVAGSCNLPHDAVGSDHLSVGIFQQQSPMWGSAQQCMDPASSAGLFYNALKAVSGWSSMTIGNAAQTVQRSAYPDRYETRAAEAWNVCNAAY